MLNRFLRVIGVNLGPRVIVTDLVTDPTRRLELTRKAAELEALLPFTNFIEDVKGDPNYPLQLLSEVPQSEEFVYRGMRCEAHFNRRELGYLPGVVRGWYCGYVHVGDLPKDHPIFTAEDMQPDHYFEVHGGVTFLDEEWVGFDCSHYRDAWWYSLEPTKYLEEREDVFRDAAYVRAQCESLVDQILLF